MKKIILPVFPIIVCLTAIGQPTQESQRGSYSVEQVRNARENAEMNRHYSSMSSGSTFKSKWGEVSNYAGPSSWGAGMSESRIQAGNRLAMAELKWQVKVEKMTRLIKERKIGTTASFYPMFMQAAKESFNGYNDDYNITRLFPQTAEDYENRLKDKEGSFYRDWFVFQYREEVAKRSEEEDRIRRKQEEQDRISRELAREEFLEKQKAEHNAKYLEAANYKNIYLDRANPLEKRLSAIKSFKDKLEDMNIDAWYDDDKIPTVHLNYFIAELETKMGRFSDAYNSLMKLFGKTWGNIAPTMAQVVNLKMYTNLLEEDYRMVVEVHKESYERETKNLA